MKNTDKKRLQYWFFSILLLLAISLFELGPLLWMLYTSFTPAGSEFSMPAHIIPKHATFENYLVVTGEGFQIQRALANSLIVSSSAMLGTILLSGMAAFVIARLRFRYRSPAFFAIQLAGLVPPIIVIAPTFILLRNTGVLGTLWAMILPHMGYGIPLATLLITGFFTSVPLEIDEAARMDGASTIRIFFQILLPIIRPVLFSAGVLSFLGSWGDFMHAFTVSLGLPRLQTVPVAILSFSSAFQMQWTWIAAGVVIAVLPVVILVVFFQRYLISGLTRGAI